MRALIPAVLALLGGCKVVDAPDELDGESLVPLLSDPSQRDGRGVVTMFDPGNASLRTDRWRYIHYADGSEELYDLQQDADEWENLASAEEHAGQKASLHQVLSPFLLRTDSR